MIPLKNKYLLEENVSKLNVEAENVNHKGRTYTILPLGALAQICSLAMLAMLAIASVQLKA